MGSRRASVHRPGPGDARPVIRKPSTVEDVGDENRHPSGQYSVATSSVDDDSEDLSRDRDEKDDGQELSNTGYCSATPSGKRTVSLGNLPGEVTFEQITDAVRGGALLHIYLRARRQIANVSFVEEDAAQEFLNHARKYGIYIGGKQVATPSPFHPYGINPC